MRIWALFLTVVAVTAQERTSLRCRVTDSGGNTVANATVMVYEAGVRKGYSAYCPRAGPIAASELPRTPQAHSRSPA